VRKEEISTQELLRVPPFLDEICMRCLGKDRAQRPQSMEEVAEVLERAMKPRPAAAPPADIAPKPAPAPPPPPPAPPARRGLVLAAGLTSVLALALATVLLLLGLGDVERAPDPEAIERRAAEIDARLAEFRPDRAAAIAGGFELLEPRAEDIRHEIDRVAALHERVVRALSSMRPALPELVLRRGTLAGARLLGADARSLRISHGGTERAVPWEGVEPSEIVRLTRLALPEPADADRLALGLYCLKAGRTEEAREEFLSLRGGALAFLAERYLSRLDR
jgi:hypothetical protein